jgi:hypothetical protein
MAGTEARSLCEIGNAKVLGGIRGNPALRFLQRR